MIWVREWECDPKEKLTETGKHSKSFKFKMKLQAVIVCMSQWQQNENQPISKIWFLNDNRKIKLLAPNKILLQ